MRMILVLLALLVLSRPATAAPPESLLGARSAAAVLDPFTPENGKPVTTWECSATGCKAVSKVPYANQHGQYPPASAVCFVGTVPARNAAPVAYASTTVTRVEKRVSYRSSGGRERFRRDREGPLRRLFSRFRR